jgi:diguanylate cyclase (GGDEF)-like protein
MQVHAIAIVTRTLRRYRTTIWESALLLALMVVAALIAYEFDIFPNPPGVPTQEHVIEADEALALATLLCLGLLALSWHFLLLQRREVTRRIEAERHAHELAMQDALTGLPNRRRFDQELLDALSAPPHSHGAHAVFLLDLNAFKRVNDLYGHGIGDEVLINIAMRLRRAARQQDLVARFGGDEFAILARELAGSEDATNVALRVIKELDQPITTGSLKHHVGVGIGIALFPQDGRTEIEILRRADIALYRAKDEKPKSVSRFFDAGMDARTQERDLIERDLPGAIVEGDVRSFYQPLIDLQTKHIAGFESLARWRHPTLGEVSPERFIPVAESCGLMSELTDHLLRQAARDATRWP